MPDTKPGSTSNRVSSAIMYAAIAAAPFPFGSSSPLPIAFWCGFLGVGVASASPRHLSKAHGIILIALCLMSASWLFVVHEQLAQHPWFATPQPLWTQASAALGNPLKSSASIVRGQPWFALGASMADMLALILSLVVGTETAARAPARPQFLSIRPRCYGARSRLMWGI
jgi:hypothetical protein